MARQRYAATLRLLQRAPEITAIFACNDDVALHVIRAVQDSGLRVPEDISVIGFDDTDHRAEHAAAADDHAGR